MYHSDSSFSSASSLDFEASDTSEPQASLHEDYIYILSQPQGILDIANINVDEAWYEAGQALCFIIQSIHGFEEELYYSSPSSTHTLSNTQVDTPYEPSTLCRSQPELYESPPTSSPSDTEEVSMRNLAQPEKTPDMSPNHPISREHEGLLVRNLQASSVYIQGQTPVLRHSSLNSTAPVEEKEAISSTIPLLCTRCKRSMETGEDLRPKRSKSF
ncbi:hypothetical protein DSO57_1021986 [Entomophthora muscae]|uniref:Uncharacterized protein n=1 Tax=Entomophthora muscae TaxID=34485 RepID=A0ACC2T457_9FUNG|nr:hypothetical protein DSO57_1021986 [Entomophthora muscae]